MVFSKAIIPINLIQENFSNFLIFSDDAVGMCAANRLVGQFEFISCSNNMQAILFCGSPSMFMYMINGRKDVIHNFNSASQ